MSKDKPDFIDSMFDVNFDGKVDSWDFAQMAYMQDLMDEEEKEEAREDKRVYMKSLGIDSDDYSDEELDDLDESDIETITEDESEDAGQDTAEQVVKPASAAKESPATQDEDFGGALKTGLWVVLVLFFIVYIIIKLTS